MDEERGVFSKVKLPNIIIKKPFLLSFAYSKKSKIEMKHQE